MNINTDYIFVIACVILVVEAIKWGALRVKRKNLQDDLQIDILEEEEKNIKFLFFVAQTFLIVGGLIGFLLFGYVSEPEEIDRVGTVEQSTLEYKELEKKEINNPDDQENAQKNLDEFRENILKNH